MIFLFGRFRKRGREVPLPADVETSLPEDLERFRVKREELPTPPFGPPPEPIAPSTEARNLGTDDKIELILQKLDTIDTRLKLIEERMKRY